MELTEIVTDKFYWEIRFEDIPQHVALGIRCGCCRHEAPTDRERLRKRSGEAYVRFSTKFTRCTNCGNRHHNRVYVVGELQRPNSQQ